MSEETNRLTYNAETPERSHLLLPKNGKQLLLPVDTTVAKAFPDPIDATIEVMEVDSDKIPADNGGSVSFSHSLCHRDSTFCKYGVLKYAHRTVPYYGLGKSNDLFPRSRRNSVGQINESGLCAM